MEKAELKSLGSFSPLQVKSIPMSDSLIGLKEKKVSNRDIKIESYS
jgi:hypothetical protein